MTVDSYGLTTDEATLYVNKPKPTGDKFLELSLLSGTFPDSWLFIALKTAAINFFAR